MVDVQVVENGQGQRFEARVGGELAGVVEYIPLPGKIIATHTEVRSEFEGQGVASRLVAEMLEQLRSSDRLVQPLCPYVRKYLHHHPEFADIVDRTTPH